MRSLRNRLLAAMLAAMFVILIAAASLLFALIRGALVVKFDEALLAKARGIASVAEWDEGRFELDLEATQMPEFEPGDRAEYFQIWSSDGSVLVRSASLAGLSLDASKATEIASYRFTELPNGRPGRQVTVVTPVRADHGGDVSSGEPALSNSQAPVTISIARDTVDLNETLWRLATLLGLVAVATALLSVLLVTLVVNYALKPVDLLARQISEIDPANVTNKGRLVCSIQELDPVVDRLNELLERLDEAFAREKAFTADVAHELRHAVGWLIDGFGGLCHANSRRDGLSRRHPKMPRCDAQYAIVGGGPPDAGKGRCWSIDAAERTTGPAPLCRRLLAAFSGACYGARASSPLADR